MSDEAPRRRDATATKAALLEAARELFTERGFDATTVRDIAARAGVNQALLFRYYGSKDALFNAAMDAPGFQLLTETPPELLVARVLERLLAPDAPRAEHNPIYAVLRSSAHERTSSVMRGQLGEEYRRALSCLSDAEDADVRADLVLAWLLGIGLVRSVLEKEPLASADADQVTAHVLRAVAQLLERSANSGDQ
jgi:AcrR family transcriptional regulator